MCNFRSLWSKIDEVEFLAGQLDLDIMAFTESWMFQIRIY